MDEKKAQEILESLSGARKAKLIDGVKKNIGSGKKALDSPYHYTGEDAGLYIDKRKNKRIQKSLEKKLAKKLAKKNRTV